MRWPWTRDEARAAAAPPSPRYTDLVIAAMVGGAEGAPADPAATAALEAAAGLVSRSLSMATVEGASSARAAALHPATLACAGREMMRRGEALFVLGFADGQATARPAAHWDVRGRAGSWWYRADLPDPDGTETLSVPAESVMHVRYAVDPSAPWRGVGPLQWASATGRLSGALEAALAGEAAGPAGHVIPVPDTGAAGEAGRQQKAALRADLQALRGGLRLVDTLAAGWGAGRGVAPGGGAPSGDWMQRRIGADPPPSVVSLRSDAALAVLAACGVPAALVMQGDGQGRREAWREFLHGTIQPLAAIVEQEARRKLGAPGLSLSFDRLFASDLSGRARAFQSMVGGGMAIADAAALAGLMEPDP